MPTTTSSTALPTSSSFVLISEASAVHSFWKALARLNVFSAHELESLPAVMALYAPSTALIASFEIPVRLDLARRVVILHHEHADVLARMGGVVGVELDLAEQHDAPAPVEGVLVEVIRRRLLLAGALVVGQRIRLTLLAQDVDLKFGSSFQPTLKVVHEMGFREIQARRRGRRWREPQAAARQALDGGRGGRKVGLDWH